MVIELKTENYIVTDPNYFTKNIIDQSNKILTVMNADGRFDYFILELQNYFQRLYQITQKCQKNTQHYKRKCQRFEKDYLKIFKKFQKQSK